MAKLYPPYLEGTLPAFSLNNEGNGVMTIPFVLNRAVSPVEVQSVKIKIKTVQNDVLLASLDLSKSGGHLEPFDSEGNGTINFNIMNFKMTPDSTFEFKIGQYYKIQLALVEMSTEVEGYYSTVGVIKCTSDPIVGIVGLNKSEINKNAPEFTGIFTQAENGDVTEKVYSSYFEVFYPDGTLAYTSGDILHNIQNDVKQYTSTESYSFNRDIPEDTIYTIRYVVTTTNGLVKSSPLYYITNLLTHKTTVKGNLKATLNYDEGYIDLTIEDETGVELSNGTYILSREDKENPGYWEELTKFSINNELVDSMLLFRDFYIQQGKYYTYSLQQYNGNGIYTDRKLSNLVYADFEDIFLYDGTRQLKLRFNPQISSFKTQLAETRTETIGSKYPFFFRNARIAYKTFPISGLISMLSDENELFTNFDSIMREVYLYHRQGQTEEKAPYKSTDLLSKNMLSERLFKLKVLDWLNDGKVKLFKSPAEGNYLVRLMDVTLSPEKALGRMLHNVSMTAYECDELNRKNYLKNGILKEIPKEDVIAQVSSVRTIGISDIVFNESGHSNNLFKSVGVESFTTFLRLFDLKPGTKIELVFNKDRKFIPESGLNPNNGIIITIGATGNYIADNVTPIYGIYIIDENNGKDILSGVNPTISYAGEDLYKNEFNLINDVHTCIGTTKQIVGDTGIDIFTNLNSLKNPKTGAYVDISKKETCFYIDRIDLFKRPIQYVYKEKDTELISGDKVWGRINTSSGSEDYGYFLQVKDGLFLNYSDLSLFTHKNVMEYEPFGLFVVKDMAINNQDILNHYSVFLDKNNNYNNEIEHDYQHILEKYFIDKIMMSTSAEEQLINQSLAYLQLQEEDNEEARTWLEEHPLYVIDGWTGEIYLVGEDFIYNPSFTYNGSKIDLLELETYSFEKIKSEDNVTILLNNGVYANVYYQKTITDYSLEKDIATLIKPSLPENWDEWSWEDKNVKLNRPDDNGYNMQYIRYIDEVSTIIDRYFAKN